MSLITVAIATITSMVIEKEVKDTQSSKIADHKEKGFVPGVRVRVHSGIQRKREGVIETVKHLWLILKDDEGDRFRILVSNCEVIEKKQADKDSIP